jgi:hypothetical protein
VKDLRANEIARVPIGTGRPLKKSEAVRRRSRQAIRKLKTIIQRLDEAARRAGRPSGCEGDD